MRSLRVLPNCILFTFVLLFHRRASEDRRRKCGTPSMHRGSDHWVIRRSDYGPFAHVLHGRMGNDGKIRVVSYKPVSPRKRALPPPLFAGKVVWGDMRKKLGGD